MQHHLPMNTRQKYVPEFPTNCKGQMTVRQKIDLQKLYNWSIRDQMINGGVDSLSIFLMRCKILCKFKMVLNILYYILLWTTVHEVHEQRVGRLGTPQNIQGKSNIFDGIYHIMSLLILVQPLFQNFQCLFKKVLIDSCQINDHVYYEFLENKNQIFPMAGKIFQNHELVFQKSTMNFNAI